jgi:Cu/Ag efflux protein CusF
MQLYKVILLVNLAVGVGFVLGSIWWGQEVRRLRGEAVAIRQGELGLPSSERRWSAHGIVRVIAPEINRVFIDHEAIPGLMEAMTMAFEPKDPAILNGLASGDEVRFILQQEGKRLWLLAIEKERNP